MSAALAERGVIVHSICLIVVRTQIASWNCSKKAAPSFHLNVDWSRIIRLRRRADDVERMKAIRTKIRVRQVRESRRPVSSPFRSGHLLGREHHLVPLLTVKFSTRQGIPPLFVHFSTFENLEVPTMQPLFSVRPVRSTSHMRQARGPIYGRPYPPP